MRGRGVGTASFARVGLVALAWLATSSVALACPVCFVGQNEENRVAYVVSSVGLTLLPFVVIGGIVFWIWRRVRAADAAVPVEGAVERLD